MISNREISKLFTLYSELLLLHRKDEKLANLLSGAAYRLRSLPDDVTGLNRKKIAGMFRPEITALLEKLKKKPSIPALDELVQLTPGGLFEMMRIKGLGGKKLAVLWNEAGIDTPEALLQACKTNTLTTIAGFGSKTQENIIKAIEHLNSNTALFHYASVADTGIVLSKGLSTICKTKQLSLCGEIRRKSTTVSHIEIITSVTAQKIKQSVPRKVLIITSSEKDKTVGHTTDEIPVIIYHCDKTKYIQELFTRTGNHAHVQKIWSKAGPDSLFKSEAEIYEKAGLPYIEPEMRENLAEWDYSKKINSLINLEDIKGVVHNHTTWSDGVDTLEDFVGACKRKGFEYVVISDHSKNAHYAGGLKEDKVLQQMKAIEALNKDLAPFRIFKSIECDIRVSGELDYEPALLKKFDMVIISIHQLLKMNEEKATARLIKAIENPFTTILGHMTGRQLLIRPGYPVNFSKVIDACAANGVVIEINANPYRLDMDWSHIPYAVKKGVMISVNPDAHSLAEIDNIQWGIAAARKGGLTKEMTWNAMNLEGIEKWLRKKSKTR